TPTDIYTLSLHDALPIYRGIASEANTVLVKVGMSSRVRHSDLARGIRWVLRHREEFKIRIINISAGGDFEASYLTDELSQAAERSEEHTSELQSRRDLVC